MEKEIPYVIPRHYLKPNVKVLDVMILWFRRRIGSDEGVALMDNLGVRPLIFEEHIQYGTQHPSHQEKKNLVALTKYILEGNPYAPVLAFGGDGRGLGAAGWGGDWVDGCRFLVVRK